MKRCEDCKWWNSDIFDPETRDSGVCEKIYSHHDVELYLGPSSEQAAVECTDYLLYPKETNLYTFKNFGCVLWEEEE